YRRGLLSLTRRKLGVTAVHVCSPSDLLAPGPGATLVLDCESTRSQDALVTRELASRYEAVVRDFFGEIDTFCSATGINYA
ncbi:MAG: hypothetical protein RDV41_08340, partial [Planctomycetota bacterium]|nr:hypothetical protein [Planctomycetota bacterium]